VTPGPDDVSNLRYEVLSERIVAVKASADRHFERVEQRLDRLGSALDERLADVAREKADRADVEKLDAWLTWVLRAVVGFSLTTAGSALLLVLQMGGRL
jgi:hypothetical protein